MDFAAATGAAKVREVQRAKQQYDHEYNPATDYWFSLRTAIVRLHEQGAPSSRLDALVPGLSPTRVVNYVACIDAYKVWLSLHRVESLGSHRKNWRNGELIVGVNPELHVRLDDAPHLIKLYFRAPEISRARLDVALQLLRLTAPPETTAAVLDIRRGRLHVARSATTGLDALLAGEAASFLSIWQQL
jgi:hypothetical protein